MDRQEKGLRSLAKAAESEIDRLKRSLLVTLHEISVLKESIAEIDHTIAQYQTQRRATRKKKTMKASKLNYLASTERAYRHRISEKEQEKERIEKQIRKLDIDRDTCRSKLHASIAKKDAMKKKADQLSAKRVRTRSRKREEDVADLGIQKKRKD